MSLFLTDENGRDSPDPEVPHAFVQYKGTDICLDFHCECGAHCHFDGYFAHMLVCPHCLTEWEMPPHVIPRKRCAGTVHPPEMNQMMEADED